MDDDGFYMAELRGHRGLVPSNFLTDAPHGTAGGVGGVVGGVAGGVGGAMKGLLGGVTGGMGVSGAAGPAVPPRGGVQGKKGETKITPLPLFSLDHCHYYHTLTHHSHINIRISCHHPQKVDVFQSQLVALKDTQHLLHFFMSYQLYSPTHNYKNMVVMIKANCMSILCVFANC